jgi:hypothetical protein
MKTGSTPMLHIYVEEKRAKDRQMRLRTGLDRSRRTLPYVSPVRGEYSRRWRSIARAQRFLPV